MGDLHLLTIMVGLCLAQYAYGQLRAQSCSITCPGIAPLSDDTNERGHVGPPGKRGANGRPGLPGPSGEKGSKGDQGPKCDCEAMADEVESLKRSLRKLTNFTLTSGEWRKATNNHWYKLFRTKMAFASAREHCKKNGAILASAGMRNNTIISEVISLFQIPAGEFIWIGLSDLEQEGVWVWDDGSSQPASFWESGQPDDHKSVEDCGHFWTNYRFNDAECTAGMHALCETDEM